MDAQERSQLADALKTETYAAGDYIVTAGDDGSTFYIAYFGCCGGGCDLVGARRWEVRPAGEAALRRGKSHVGGALEFCCFVLVLAAGHCVLLSLLDATTPPAFVDSSFVFVTSTEARPRPLQLWP